MKISNSKKELARIISENGGGRYAAQFYVSTCNGIVIGSKNKPKYTSKYGWVAPGGFIDDSIEMSSYLKNWHQTILSRDEYLHLYPAPDADGWNNLGSSVARDVVAVDGRINTGTFGDGRPTIEQLASECRNLKDFALRKQQEADDAKADADARLKALELAGEALGLLVSPITAKQEQELVIAVQVGDEVECIKSNVNPNKYRGMIGTALEVDDSSTPYLVDFGGEAKIWCHEVKFIRRP